MPDNIKTALITGAGGAIGEAIAVRLSQLGHRVLLLDQNSERITELAHRIGELAVPLAFDLAMVSEIERVISDIDVQFGGVDILINNAGVLSNNKIADTDMPEWRRVHKINLDSAFELTKCVLPAMRSKRWGRIINMSSYAAKSGGLTAGTAYTVTKSAVIGLTFSTAREVARQGITANAIAPCYVTSPMVTEQLSEEQRQVQLADIPVGRFCEPREVAHAVEFLASPLAGFITGEVLDMNGGFHFD